MVGVTNGDYIAGSPLSSTYVRGVSLGALVVLDSGEPVR
jgi:hypothetical protein